jgi:hypothetical protein
LPDLHVASSDGFQCFPFYTYSEDGAHRLESITDWALEQFRSHYHDPSITKWDIFHYVYAVLHHPEYRARYAANLKRELPRIPFVDANRVEQGFSLADKPNAEPAASAAEANRVEQGFSPADSKGEKDRALAPEVESRQGRLSGQHPGGTSTTTTISFMSFVVRLCRSSIVNLQSLMSRHFAPTTERRACGPPSLLLIAKS